MNEISLQAVQFIPRFISVVVYLPLTWIVAKFAGSMILRAACKSKKAEAINESAQFLSKFVFWITVLLLSPFILGAAGLDAAWILRAQAFQGQFFSNWPIWMFSSLLVAAVSYLAGGLPKFYEKLRESPGRSSRNELQS